MSWFSTPAYLRLFGTAAGTDMRAPALNVLGRRGASRRALLIYLPQAFRLPKEHPDQLWHQNRRRSWQIVECLDELGYSVDVVATTEKRFRPPAPYDFVLSNNTRLKFAVPLRPGARLALLATTLYPDRHNANLRGRHDWLASRRGVRLAPRRQYSVDAHDLRRFAAILCVGNPTNTESWRPAFGGPIHSFNNFGHSSTEVPTGKDFEAARRHFLFFASGSQMQKGLDLLLEAFARNPDCHLHVCSSFADEPDFCRAFQRELFETPNIHPVGKILTNGPKFNELLARCGHVISASCSEGQSGAVVQTAYAGLVPLVTPEVGLDVAGYGDLLPSDSLEGIAAAIGHRAEQSASWLRERSGAALAIGQRLHGEGAVQDRWREMLGAVLSLQSAAAPLSRAAGIWQDRADAAGPIPANTATARTICRTSVCPVSGG
ncbi:MAG: hypothetical protein SFU86_10825 [Pirellulaceae bacterium]|nr:hypothetical protein [Pirellulaceae bacterium]